MHIFAPLEDFHMPFYHIFHKSPFSKCHFIMTIILTFLHPLCKSRILFFKYISIFYKCIAVQYGVIKSENC